jgi:hypothetical protein
MNGIPEVQVFFIISSVGFVALWVFVAVLLYYLIKITRIFHRIIEKAESDINKVGDVTREMFEDMKDSAAWNLIFRRKKSRRKEKDN